jgi:hypothetical protein
MRALVVISLSLVLLNAPLWAGEQPPASPPPASKSLDGTQDRSEQSWRNSFRQLHRGLAAVEACRARLPDYCSWEYRKSREESEIQAFREYIDAKRRGEDVKDPLEGKVYVPKECEDLFDEYPDSVTLRPDPAAPDSCRTRVATLIRAIDEVARYWKLRRGELEREARRNAVPRSWRE